MFLQKLSVDDTTVLPGLSWPPFFVVYSFMVISIEKEITETNLDIESVIKLFSHWSMIFYIGWNKMEFLCVYVSPLWISPQVYLIDI